jgi:hypothetical protein
VTAQSDTATDRERSRLAKLVTAHAGNRSAIARALSDDGKAITRQGVSAQLRRFGLLEEADRLSVASNKPGPRDNVPRAELRRQREALIAALASVETYDEAPVKLGYSSATMYRLIKLHGITPRQVAARRKKLAAK